MTTGSAKCRDEREHETRQDTIYNPSALDISLLADVQLNELPKATGVVVVYCLRVAKRFHDGAVNRASRAEH